MAATATWPWYCHMLLRERTPARPRYLARCSIARPHARGFHCGFIGTAGGCVGQRLRIALAMLALILSGSAQSHSGGLDKNGCHTNRRTGDYHCHRGTPPPPAHKPPAGRTAPSRLTTSQRLAPATAQPFRNCDEARAAGAAPVRRGDPGYGSHLDRDNDGIGCEPYRGRR